MSECHGGTKSKDSNGLSRKFIYIFMTRVIKGWIRNTSVWKITIPAKTEIGQISPVNIVPPMLAPKCAESLKR